MDCYAEVIFIKKYTLPEYSFEYTHSVDDKPSKGLDSNHCHDTYEILYVSDGRGKYYVEGAHFNLKPRTILLIRPFQHHCVKLDSDSVYERYVLHFHSGMLCKEIRQTLDKMAGSGESESGSFFSPASISQDIISLFDKLDRGDQFPEEERLMYLRLMLSELVLLLSVASKERIAHENLDVCSQVAKYINDFLDQRITLDDIAKRFFVSKYYLCRSFKKYSGVSIHSYITNKRVIYAKRLMEEGETASGAAYKVGFGDYSAFYRAYVKILGMPPTHK